ncbi:hypothetical protein [Nocardioides panaciterrulae]|uniref:Uncharacterized protein n=1 Tax=Nocardioides panaciterrulae TaxID=661492 RepID=A0A7Y9E6T0_9ACTN|nr:hypothetical protein [Nocardioides panaciterrulae]NYD42195.1 hypothetical protein [Nocardioides panaciterrulae]
MREDADFTDYVEARWPTLVRTLVLLGRTPAGACRVAERSLASCQLRWRTIRTADDIDVRVYGEAYAELLAARRRPAADIDGADEADASGPPEAAAAAPADAVLVLESLLAALDRLAEPDRVAVVLQHGAGLGAVQVAELLEVDPFEVEQRVDSAVTALDVEGVRGAPRTVLSWRPGPQEAVDEVFAVAGSAIEVPVPPLAAIEARAGAHRRRRRRRAAAAVAAVLLVAGLGTYVGARPVPGTTPTPPRVLDLDNPAPAAWWANGVLHLAGVSVLLPRVEELVDLGGGAVIGEEDGAVVLVSATGELTTIGRKIPGAPLAATAEHGLVAWVDPGDQRPRLVLYDIDQKRVRAEKDLQYRGPRWGELDEGSYPIAIDGETVYYADQFGDWRWRPPYQSADPVDHRGLVDVSSAVVLRQLDQRTLDVVQPFFSVDHQLEGAAGAQLSPGGEYVLTRVPGGPAFGPVRIYDARSGERLWTGLRPGDQVLDASLGPEDVVTYVTAHRADQPEAGEFVRMSFTGPYELRVCRIGERTCFRVTRFPHTGALPVLAR